MRKIAPQAGMPCTRRYGEHRGVVYRRAHAATDR